MRTVWLDRAGAGLPPGYEPDAVMRSLTVLPLVLAHLASDVKGLLRQGGPWVAADEALDPDDLPHLRMNAVAGYVCGNFDYRGFPAVAVQSTSTS